jgi:predicted nuclease of predicted toxin-antitoxin system
MRILLDECVPAKLRSFLQPHSVFTVQMMGWSGTKNGDLIKLADPQFDVFITIDKNLSYQQNLTRIRMSIILISLNNNRFTSILSKSDDIKTAINNVSPSSFIVV